jgi:hypothetical protein
VQLLGNLTLQRHEQHIDWVKTESGQESRSLRGLRIPRIRCVDADVYLEWFESPSGKRTFQFVPNGETDTGFAKFFAARDRESEVVANILDCGSLQIGAGRFCALDMIRIQVERGPSALAEPALNGHSALQCHRFGATFIRRTIKRSRAAWRRTMYAGTLRRRARSRSVGA